MDWKKLLLKRQEKCLSSNFYSILSLLFVQIPRFSISTKITFSFFLPHFLFSSILHPESNLLTKPPVFFIHFSWDFNRIEVQLYATPFSSDFSFIFFSSFKENIIWNTSSSVNFDCHFLNGKGMEGKKKANEDVRGEKLELRHLEMQKD